MYDKIITVAIAGKWCYDNQKLIKAIVSFATGCRCFVCNYYYQKGIKYKHNH